MTVLPAGLIGRWGLDDGTGTVALNSVLGRPNGSLLPRQRSAAAAGAPGVGRRRFGVYGGHAAGRQRA